MVWQYILTFILFIVCLSVLIMIHELGHLAAAKIFKVYCFDYSIGFGPALLHKKRKNGETYFSIRAFPFGGFVSMYGEQDENVELPDGVKDIPPERALNKIKAWKRAIILVAGVTLNFVLALVLFFVSNALPKQQLYIRGVEVNETSAAYVAGLRNDDMLYYEMPVEYHKADTVGHEDEYVLVDKQNDIYYLKNDSAYIALDNGYYMLDKDAYVTYQTSETHKIVVAIDGTNKSKLSFKIRDYDTIVCYFDVLNDGTMDFSKKFNVTADNISSVTVNFKTVIHNEETQKDDIDKNVSFTLNNVSNKLDSYGISMFLHTYRYNAGQVFKHSFEDFGNSSGLIFRTLGGLFIGKGWNNVGGIVAIYHESSQIFMNYNASLFIYLWALISVNLGIVNLLPFPGLDGYQLLVLFVEKVFRKEIPAKVKNIISLVGMALLFTLMILIIIKDVAGIWF